MKPLSEFCCIDTDCSEHGKRGGKNLRVHQTYGKSDTIRLLECKVCGRKFSERAHTALSGSRLPKEKIILLKAVDNGGYADWWVQVEMLLVV